MFGFTGQYREHESGLVIPNTFVAAGASLFLRHGFRNEAVMPAILYLGLTNVASYTFDSSTLADIAAGEPVGNGYARQALTRNTTDWTVQEVNGIMQAVSKRVTFTASANWDKTWSRMFLTDQAAGTVGVLFSVSGPAPAPRTVLSGAGPTVSYEFWQRG